MLRKFDKSKPKFGNAKKFQKIFCSVISPVSQTVRFLRCINNWQLFDNTLKSKNYIILPYTYKQLKYTVILRACKFQNNKLQTMNNIAKKRKKIKEYPTKPVQTKVVGSPNTVFFFTETKAGCKMFFTTLSNTPKNLWRFQYLILGEMFGIISKVTWKSWTKRDLWYIGTLGEWFEDLRLNIYQQVL